MNILMGAIFLWLSSSPAMAARAGTVDVELAELRQFPDKISVVLATLHKGTRLVASNIPTLGFHRVRLRNSLVGWVSAEALVLQPVLSPAALPTLPAQSPPPPSPPQSPPPTPVKLETLPPPTAPIL